jgi:membrane-associated phospholipid phosphatase
MLPTPTHAVKSAVSLVVRQQLLISLIFGGLALGIWLLNLDTPLAHALYQPGLDSQGRQLAALLRNIGTLPAGMLAFAGLVIMLWPKLWKKHPILYRTAAVMALTTVLGVGLLNQIIIKDFADRPRPRESVLLDIPTSPSTDAFRGNSMPSGHAAMGFALAIPFFPLRLARKKRLAYTFLGIGIVWGTVIGASRMALGAHFATDVLIAGLITLSSASLCAWAVSRITRIPPLLIGLGTLVAALSVILGNRFTNMQLHLELPQPFTTINLPCEVVAVPSTATVPTLTVNLNGYGAPLSNLKLVNKNKEIYIRTGMGLYHSLTCTAQLALPPTE